MQFLLTGRDGNDDEALNRRMAARPAHLACAEEMHAKGTLALGAAILDEAGKMVGSIMILNMASRDDVDKYLASEPYITGKVWQHVDVQNISLAPHYLSKLV